MVSGKYLKTFLSFGGQNVLSGGRFDNYGRQKATEKNKISKSFEPWHMAAFLKSSSLHTDVGMLLLNRSFAHREIKSMQGSPTSSMKVLIMNWPYVSRINILYFLYSIFYIFYTFYTIFYFFLYFFIQYSIFSIFLLFLVTNKWDALCKSGEGLGIHMHEGKRCPKKELFTHYLQIIDPSSECLLSVWQINFCSVQGRLLLFWTLEFSRHKWLGSPGNLCSERTWINILW